MVRAFIDVFPHSVLLSGTQAELLLVGTTADRIEVDPERLERELERLPDVRNDLRRVDLGSVKEIVGTFLGSSATLARATRDALPVSDDRPLQEYGVRSAVSSGARSANCCTGPFIRRPRHTRWPKRCKPATAASARR